MLAQLIAFVQSRVDCDLRRHLPDADTNCTSMKFHPNRNQLSPSVNRIARRELSREVMAIRTDYNIDKDMGNVKFSAVR